MAPAHRRESWLDCLVVTLSIQHRQYVSNVLHIDFANAKRSEQTNRTEWMAHNGDRLTCSDWDDNCTCTYCTTLKMTHNRRRRVCARPFDVYDCPLSADWLEKQPTPTQAEQVYQLNLMQETRLGDISVFLDEPLRGWYFVNEPAGWLSVDRCMGYG